MFIDLRERNIDVREKHRLVASRMDWGLNLQPFDGRDLARAFTLLKAQRLLKGTWFLFSSLTVSDNQGSFSLLQGSIPWPSHRMTVARSSPSGAAGSEGH